MLGGRISAPARGRCFEVSVRWLTRLLRFAASRRPTTVRTFALLATRRPLFRPTRTRTAVAPTRRTLFPRRTRPRPSPTRRRIPHGRPGLAPLTTFARATALVALADSRSRIALRPTYLRATESPASEKGPWSAFLATFAAATSCIARITACAARATCSPSLAGCAKRAALVGPRDSPASEKGRRGLRSSPPTLRPRRVSRASPPALGARRGPRASSLKARRPRFRRDHDAVGGCVRFR